MSVSRLYPNTKENKVRVLGDSYLKEIAAKIDQFLTSNYEVSMSIYSHSIDLYKRCGNSLFVCLFAFI